MPQHLHVQNIAAQPGPVLFGLLLWPAAALYSSQAMYKTCAATWYVPKKCLCAAAGVLLSYHHHCPVPAASVGEPGHESETQKPHEHAEVPPWRAAAGRPVHSSFCSCRSRYVLHVHLCAVCQNLHLLLAPVGHPIYFSIYPYQGILHALPVTRGRHCVPGLPPGSLSKPFFQELHCGMLQLSYYQVLQLHERVMSKLSSSPWIIKRAVALALYLA